MNRITLKSKHSSELRVANKLFFLLILILCSLLCVPGGKGVSLFITVAARPAFTVAFVPRVTPAAHPRLPILQPYGL